MALASWPAGTEQPGTEPPAAAPEAAAKASKKRPQTADGKKAKAKAVAMSAGDKGVYFTTMNSGAA